MIIGKKDYGIKAGRNCNTRIVIWLRIRKFFPFSVCFFFFLHFAHYEMSWPTFSISLSVVTQHLDKEDCVTTSWDLRRSRKRKFWNCSFLESIGKVPQGKYTVIRTIFVFFFNRNPLIRVRSYRDNMQHIIVLFFSPRFKLGVFKIINRDHLVQVWILLINAQS